MPSLTTALRGDAALLVDVRTLAEAKHSGEFGGAAPDALIALIHALATLHDEHGNVAVSGLRRERWSGAAYDKQYIRARIKVAVGGRTAEEVVFGDETTGAESDIRQATQLARNMVGRWGMSDRIGFVSVLPQDGDTWWSADQPSEHTRQLMDDEIRQIIDEAHDDVTQLLADNRARLDALAEALMREETLDEADAYAAAGVEVPLETTSEAPQRDAAVLTAQAHGGADGRSADA